MIVCWCDENSAWFLLVQIVNHDKVLGLHSGEVSLLEIVFHLDFECQPGLVCIIDLVPGQPGICTNGINCILEDGYCGFIIHQGVLVLVQSCHRHLVLWTVSGPTKPPAGPQKSSRLGTRQTNTPGFLTTSKGSVWNLVFRAWAMLMNWWFMYLLLSSSVDTRLVEYPKTLTTLIFQLGVNSSLNV